MNPLTKFLRRDGTPLLLLVLFGLVVLAPLWRPSGETPVHSVFHWDTMSYHYPRLMYATAAWQNAGELPLWLPFQHLGFPNVGDPQTQLWFPLTWVVLLTVGYSVKILQLQIIGTFLLAGIGMYWCARLAIVHRASSWMAAASYMFCGYFITGAGLLGTFTTLALFPFAFGCLLAARRQPEQSLGWAALAAVFLAQCSVGGHPTTAFIGAIHLGLFWIFLPRSVTVPLIRRVGEAALLAFLTALISAPQVLGVLTLMGEIPALSERNLEIAEFDSFLARSLFNFALPTMPMYSHQSFHVAHVAHLGVYSGVLFLIGPLAAMSRAKWHPLFTILLVVAIVDFLLAMGTVTPLRSALYFFVPGMGAPHHASMDFRGYALFFGLLAAAFGWKRLIFAIKARKSLVCNLQKGVAVSMVLLVIAALTGLFLSITEVNELAQDPPFQIDPWQRTGVAFFVEAFNAQLVVLAVLMFALAWARRNPASRWVGVLLCVFVAFDMGSAVRRTLPLLADPVTAESWTALNRLEAAVPESFMPEQLTTYSDAPFEWQNVISQRVGLDCYNPMSLVDPVTGARSVEALEKEFPEYVDTRAVFESERGQQPVPITSLSANTMTIALPPNQEGTVRMLTSYVAGWKSDVGEVRPSLDSPHLLEVDIPLGTDLIEFRFRPDWLMPAIVALFFGYAAAAILVAVGLFRQKKAG